MNKVYHPTEPVITVPREQIFIKLPYLGQNSVDLVDFFVETLKKFYPQIDFKFFLGNECSIGGFFTLKEALPDELRSHIIYKYICDACQDFLNILKNPIELFFPSLNLYNIVSETIV